MRYGYQTYWVATYRQVTSDEIVVPQRKGSQPVAMTMVAEHRLLQHQLSVGESTAWVLNIKTYLCRYQIKMHSLIPRHTHYLYITCGMVQRRALINLIPSPLLHAWIACGMQIRRKKAWGSPGRVLGESWETHTWVVLDEGSQGHFM